MKINYIDTGYRGMILNIMYKICIGAICILIIILFFLNIFNKEIEVTENLSFTFEEFTPTTEAKKKLVYLSNNKSEI